MDEKITEMKNLYFIMLVDSRKGMREESAEKLLRYGDDNVNKLVEAARIIHPVMEQKAEPDKLEESIALFLELPNAKSWLGFVEISGQVVLQRALSMQKNGGTKTDSMIEHGFRMLGLAFGPGFRLSKKTISLVEKIKKSNSRFVGNAERIIAWDRKLGGEPLDKGWPFRDKEPSGKNNSGRVRKI